MDVIEDIVDRFTSRGDEAYFGEQVSQAEHALQAALEAEKSAAPISLIVAALLHDIGHLLHGKSEDIADQGVNTVHEELGERYLARWFPPAVYRPVQMHVAAKRYLCATDPSYYDLLSAASVTSLNLQGGPFTPEEVAEFEALDFSGEAAQLRRWDDMAKIPNRPTPSFHHYRPHLRKALASLG
jgi:phosphonate degradation associated HDIG domain protein